MATIEPPVSDELRNAIGVDSEPMTHEVERGAILRFAQAVEDPNPLYQDEAKARMSRYGGIIAPPTFLRSLPPGPPRVRAQSPFPRVLDGGSEWEYMEPVRPGDRITVTSRLTEAKERAGRLGPMVFMTREVRYVNQLGQLVAVQKSTLISY